MSPQKHEQAEPCVNRLMSETYFGPPSMSRLPEVYHRFLHGKRNPLFHWLHTSGPSVLCFRKLFSCKRCPGMSKWRDEICGHIFHLLICGLFVVFLSFLRRTSGAFSSWLRNLWPKAIFVSLGCLHARHVLRPKIDRRCTHRVSAKRNTCFFADDCCVGDLWASEAAFRKIPTCCSNAWCCIITWTVNQKRNCFSGQKKSTDSGFSWNSSR